MYLHKYAYLYDTINVLDTEVYIYESLWLSRCATAWHYAAVFTSGPLLRPHSAHRGQLLCPLSRSVIQMRNVLKVDSTQPEIPNQTILATARPLLRPSFVFVLEVFELASKMNPTDRLGYGRIWDIPLDTLIE